MLWAMAAMAIGCVAGAGGVVLTYALRFAAVLTDMLPLLGWLLPVGGLCAVALYRALGVSWDWGTDRVVEVARDGGSVPLLLAPAIMVATVATDLLGGSAGQEAAIFCLGGALGSSIGCRVVSGRRRGGYAPIGSDAAGTFVSCGMAGAFAALMHAPLCAACFVSELMRYRISPRRFLAMLVSALCGWGVAGFSAPDDVRDVFEVASGQVPWGAVLAAICAAMLSCAAYVLALGLVRRGSMRLAAGWKVLALGLATVLVANLFGTGGCIGPGDDLIRAALYGEAGMWDFAAKLAVTALCLGGGFKGGGLTPGMAIGACAGCTVGCLLGVEPGPCAAAGLLTALATSANAPLSVIILGLEAFGPTMVPIALVAALIGYTPTVRLSLYKCNRVSCRRAVRCGR